MLTESEGREDFWMLVEKIQVLKIAKVFTNGIVNNEYVYSQSQLP